MAIESLLAKNFSTNLEHGPLGAKIVSEEFGISDQYITDAICYHTTGRPNMTLLDKIIYVADYIEPNRDKAHDLANLRKIAFENLDDCLRIILKDTLDYLKKQQKEIDSMTEQAYEYYK